MAAAEFSFAEGWEARLGLEPCKDTDVPMWWLPVDWKFAFKGGDKPRPSRKVCVSPKGAVVAAKQDVVDKAVEREKAAEKAKLEASAAAEAAAEAHVEAKAAAPSASASASAKATTPSGRHTEKIWSHEEVLQAQAENLLQREAQTIEEKPANWPDCCRPNPSPLFTPWLPEGWAHAIKITETGTEMKCYIDENGKMHYHRDKIEKLFGGVLPNWRQQEEKEYKPPKNWPDWLPHDHGISRKMVKSGDWKTIYVNPEHTRFFWAKQGFELAQSGMGEGGKLDVDENSQLPAAKRRKTETIPAMTEEELENCDFAGQGSGKISGDGYLLCPLKDGRWVIFPEDVDMVVLTAVREHMKKLGWTCSSESERCDSYSSTSNTAGEVKIFAKSGRMLVCDKSKSVAQIAGRLYMDLLRGID